MEDNFDFIDEPVGNEELPFEPVVEESPVQPIEPEEVAPKKKSSKKAPAVEVAVAVDEVKKFKQVDNRFADVLFGSRDARVIAQYDEVMITADRQYIGNRIDFLYSICLAMVKSGGILKLSEEFDAPKGARKEGIFWIVVR